MIYNILPIQFIAVTPFLNDQTTLVRNAFAIIFPLIVLFFSPNIFSRYKTISVIFLLILFFYFVSALYNNQKWNSFLLGNYGRSDGLLVMLGLFFTFLLSANLVLTHANLSKKLNFVVNLTIILGILELLELNPIRWESGYEGIMLSLANPNFASTFIACMAIPCLYGLLENKGMDRTIYTIKYLALVFLVFNTQSSQGFLLILTGIFIFGYFELKRLFFLRKKFFQNKKIFLFFVSVFSGLIILTLNSNEKIINYINLSLNLNDRIAHWKLAIHVWNENKIFGVGLSELQSHIAEFKTYSDVRRWGDYGHPDKSHNFLLDHLANGGPIIVILFLIFFLMVTFFGFQIVLKEPNSSFQRFNVSFLIIWISYLLQNMASPSHILIETLGMLTGGYICGTYYRKFKSIIGKHGAKRK